MRPGDVYIREGEKETHRDGDLKADIKVSNILLFCMTFPTLFSVCSYRPKLTT